MQTHWDVLGTNTKVSGKSALVNGKLSERSGLGVCGGAGLFRGYKCCIWRLVRMWLLILSL